MRSRVDQNGKRAKEVAEATSDAVTQEAKKTFYEQRKTAGDDTRGQMKGWRSDRQAQRKEYLDKASNGKASTAVTTGAGVQFVEQI